MVQPWLNRITRILPQQPEREDGLDEQLRDVVIIANRIGCYDAADWIWKNYFGTGYRGTGYRGSRARSRPRPSCVPRQLWDRLLWDRLLDLEHFLRSVNPQPQKGERKVRP